MLRGMRPGGVRGRFGPYGGGGGGNRRYNIETDRHCSECGGVIWNQVNSRHSKCPSNWCRATIKFGPGQMDFKADCIIRCYNCYIPNHVDDNFCELCGWANQANIAKKQRLEIAEKEKLKIQHAAKIKSLEDELTKERAKNTQLAEVLAAEDDEHFMALTAKYADDKEEGEVPPAFNPNVPEKMDESQSVATNT